jgi:hypothetical protein
MTGIEVEKFKINTNTLVALVGFLTTFAILITMWNDARNDQANTNSWIEQHTQLHDAIAKDLAGLHQVDQSRDTQVLDLAFRIGNLEKGVEGLDLRVSRVTETYGNYFTEMRSAIGNFGTQLALANQSLQRLEALAKTPAELQSR